MSNSYSAEELKAMNALERTFSLTKNIFREDFEMINTVISKYLFEAKILYQYSTLNSDMKVISVLSDLLKTNFNRKDNMKDPDKYFKELLQNDSASEQSSLYLKREIVNKLIDVYQPLIQRYSERRQKFEAADAINDEKMERGEDPMDLGDMGVEKVTLGEMEALKAMENISLCLLTKKDDIAKDIDKLEKGRSSGGNALLLREAKSKTNEILPSDFIESLQNNNHVLEELKIPEYEDMMEKEDMLIEEYKASNDIREKYKNRAKPVPEKKDQQIVDVEIDLQGDKDEVNAERVNNSNVGKPAYKENKLTGGWHKNKVTGAWHKVFPEKKGSSEDLDITDIVADLAKNGAIESNDGSMEVELTSLPDISVDMSLDENFKDDKVDPSDLTAIANNRNTKKGDDIVMQ